MLWAFGRSAFQLSIVEHTCAISFFAKYANDMLKYRVHLLSAAGIPLSVKHIKSLHSEIRDTNRIRRDSIRELCLVIAQISEFDWCLSMLVECDICATLVSLLMYVC